MIDFKFAADVLNPNGKVRVVTALELYAQVPDADGVYYSVPVGMAQNIDISERREITYNFVIGNKNPSRVRDLIPGPVTSSTIRLNMVSLFSVNGIGLFSIPNPKDRAIAPALPYNTRPFNLVERWLNPSTGNTLYEVSYTGCYIRDYSAPKSIDGGRDIRVIENMDIDFKDIVYVPAATFDTDIASGTLGNPFNTNI